MRSVLPLLVALVLSAAAPVHASEDVGCIAGGSLLREHRAEHVVYDCDGARVSHRLRLRRFPDWQLRVSAVSPEGGEELRYLVRRRRDGDATAFLVRDLYWQADILRIQETRVRRPGELASEVEYRVFDEEGAELVRGTMSLFGDGTSRALELFARHRRRPDGVLVLDPFRNSPDLLSLAAKRYHWLLQASGMRLPLAVMVIASVQTWDKSRLSGD